MKDHFTDICNCPECHYYDTERPHCCGLPGQIKKKDIPHIREAVRCCHCASPHLWEFFDSLEGDGG